MDIHEVEGAIESILFASGEPVSVERIAAVLAIDAETVSDTASRIADRLSYERRGIRLIKLDNSIQLCSAPEYADYIRAALEVRKPPHLSPSALEALAIVAYFQPVTRAYIEQVRGVDSSHTVSVLQERGLIEACGHLDAPGRPQLFRTTKGFLRTFGISSINELPALPVFEEGEDGQIQIQNAIDALSAIEEDTGNEDGASSEE